MMVGCHPVDLIVCDTTSFGMSFMHWGPYAMNAGVAGSY